MDRDEMLIRHAVKRTFRGGESIERSSCPDEHALIRYGEGTIDGEARERIEAHLVSCDLCLDTILSFQQIREEDAEAFRREVPESLTRRSIDLVSEGPATKTQRDGVDPVQGEQASTFDVVLRFAKGAFAYVKRAVDVTPVVLEPAGVIVRGEAARRGVGEEFGLAGSDTVAFTKALGSMHVDVEVAANDEGRFNLAVKLTEADAGRPIDGLRVTLSDFECELESTRTVEGRVSFEDHEVGEYSIEIEARNGHEGGAVRVKLER